MGPCISYALTGGSPYPAIHMYIHTIFCVFIFLVFFSIFELFRIWTSCIVYALTKGLPYLAIHMDIPWFVFCIVIFCESWALTSIDIIQQNRSRTKFQSGEHKWYGNLEISRFSYFYSFLYSSLCFVLFREGAVLLWLNILCVMIGNPQFRFHNLKFIEFRLRQAHIEWKYWNVLF